MQKTKSGFTIVELLIVIVIIAVLAAITVVAYNGIKARTGDSRRLSDMAAIQKALELYKIDNGAYPEESTSGLGSQSGFEGSAREASGEFIATLKPYGFPQGVVVDPINDAVDNTIATARTNGHYEYAYYKYSPAESGNCDVTKGGFMF